MGNRLDVSMKGLKEEDLKWIASAPIRYEEYKSYCSAENKTPFLCIFIISHYCKTMSSEVRQCLRDSIEEYQTVEGIPRRSVPMAYIIRHAIDIRYSSYKDLICIASNARTGLVQEWALDANKELTRRQEGASND